MTKQPTKEWLPLQRVRVRLSNLWLFWSGGLFVIMFIQTLTPVYKPYEQDAWGWLLPLLSPTLGLMIATRVAFAMQPDDPRRVRPTYYRLTVRFSVFYLAILTAMLLVLPFYVPELRFTDADLTHEPPWLLLFRKSSIFLGPLYGLVAAVIGILFATTEQPAGT